MNNSADQPAAMSGKLNLSTKLAYGAGDFGPAVTANILSVFLLIFFTSVAGLDPGMAGSILLISKIWDAVNDPIVGMLSDKTRSRWGRRHPWMIFGAIPFGFFFFLQWLVPQFSSDPTTNQWSLFWYYIAISILFNSFYTAVNLPYTALTPELTQDYDERTSLTSFRFGFSIGGSILSLLLVGRIFDLPLLKDNPLQQYSVMGAACAVISVLPLFWCVWGTRQRVKETEHLRQETSNEVSLPYLEQLKIVFSNRPFLYVIGIYLCSWLAVQNTVSVIPYFVKNWMGLTTQDFINVIIAVQVTSFIMLFVWSEVSKRVGKKAVYFMGMTVWIIGEIGLFMLQPGQTGLLYVLAVMAGFGVSTAYLIPWSMIPDVIELDELQTGQRREGVFYAFMVLLQKVALAIGLFLVGWVLQQSGFLKTITGEADPTQPASALWAIRVLVGPAPLVVLIIGLVLAYFYPITKEVHAEILLKLQERNRERSQENQ
ncbi:MFS transporter [Phormidesmis priestleyi ULC007]|uniref:MFS transporter n=1 Tax=Phormidesmis priestleyi ULC007 TaxID=1920490 RepID=A0A2T1DM85_9CYAN|nr:MFS transporter [Phormidesmis priestleyi]PSB21610.1 MFS transporter [Phormidesmis priestleyi ULC007]PZO54651.1 MAG: MFS transporter [Phormidesmis priestleyi]